MEQSQRQAVAIIGRVLDGAALPAAMAAVDLGNAGAARALVQELAYGTLRHFGRLDALQRMLASKPLVDRDVALLVDVALYQIAHTRAPAFAIVDQAVDAVVAMGKPAAKSLVNALLRRYLRERVALDARAASGDDPVARYSYPLWWVDRVRRDFPAQWQQVFYDFDNLKEHAEHIAQFRARFGERFIEGYGHPLVNGKEPYGRDGFDVEKGININVVSEDNDCDVFILSEK